MQQPTSEYYNIPDQKSAFLGDMCEECNPHDYIDQYST
jgi:hypothetical protein